MEGRKREDRLIPVITLIIFFSPEQWDGPRTLAEMMDTDDPVLLSMIPDYRIHLVSPAEIPSVDFGKFHTSLGDVLESIKYLGNKEEMSAWLKGPGTQVSFGQKEVEVLNACVNAKLKAREEEETIMVKTSFDLLLEEESMKAAQQFVGEMAGKIALELAEKVEKETAEKAEKEKAKAIRVTSERIQLEGIRNLMKNLHMTAEQAIAALGISGEDKKKLMSKL